MTFGKPDDWMHWRAMRYTKHTHPTKSGDWRIKHYFGQLNPAHQLWLTGRYSSEVYAINTRNGKLIKRIKVGLGPHGLCRDCGGERWRHRRIRYRLHSDQSFRTTEHRRLSISFCGPNCSHHH